MRYPMLFSLSMFAAACSEDKPVPPKPTAPATAQTAQALTTAIPSPDPARLNATSYPEIRGGAVLDEIPSSICELLKFSSGGAGAYRVKSITGYTEELLELPGKFDAFTYVELELVADWSGTSPANPVVRITGGPISADLTKLWTIVLKVGEVVGFLVTPASAVNRGFPGLDPVRVFREKSDGGYSNGQLFTKQAVALDTIGHTVQNLVNLGTACSQQDVLPDLDGYSPSRAFPATGVQTVTTSEPSSPSLDGGTR